MNDGDFRQLRCHLSRLLFFMVARKSITYIELIYENVQMCEKNVLA